MTKFIQILFCFFFLLVTKSTFSQNVFKIGPSLTYNVSLTDEEVYPAFGGEIAYEIGLGKKFSTNLAVIYHYSQHDNSFDENITTTDHFTGLQAELRWYFKEKFNGGYMGLGMDTKLLISKNHFPPSPLSPNETLENWEFNVGITIGYESPMNQESLNFKTDEDLYINPFLYIGLNPSDQNEFELHTRLGLSFGF